MDITWIDIDGSPVELEGVVASAATLERGDILALKHGTARTEHFLVVEISEQEAGRTVTVKSITPRFMNTVYLLVGLAGWWFLMEEAMAWLF